MAKNDAFGDRMKFYEEHGLTSKYLMPLVPGIIRLDGKAFHTFTKGLRRPYDQSLTSLMRFLTHELVKYSNAKIGYTQSDEITLVLYSNNQISQVFFDGKIQKINSILAAYASSLFNKELPNYLQTKGDYLALFDCRSFSVPTKQEAINCLIWRENDATRNSISMAAQSVYSHNELLGKSCDEMQEMLFQKGINWNDYPSYFKRGTYVQRIQVLRSFTTDEIEKLPPKHAARSVPDLKVLRSEVKFIDMPPIKSVENMIGVVFDEEKVRTNNGN